MRGRCRQALVLLPFAWCCCAASQEAPAENGLRLSGRVDLGVQYAPAQAAKSTARRLAVADSSNGRLNFSGRESLGQGHSAFFMLELRFDGDTGRITDPATPFRDKSWLGLAGPWGEFKLGRLHSPQYGEGVAGPFEAFQGDSYASMSMRGARSASRWSDALAYAMPLAGGIEAGVIFQAASPTAAAGRGAHVVFTSGGTSWAVSWQREQDTLVSTHANALSTWTLAAAADLLPGFRVMGTAARSSAVNATDSGTETVLTAGLRLAAGPGQVRAAVRRLRDVDRMSRADRSGDEDSLRLSVGYHYPFSRRTSANLSLVREHHRRWHADGRAAGRHGASGAEAALRVKF